MALTDEEMKVARKTIKRVQQNSKVSNQSTEPFEFVGGVQLTTIQDQSTNHLASITSQLTQIATERNEAIEKVSDVLAYLHSPESFENEVLARTAQKLSTVQKSTECLSLAGLKGSFNLAGFDIPKIASDSSMGALPL